jgi:hypothetical protein
MVLFLLSEEQLMLLDVNCIPFIGHCSNVDTSVFRIGFGVEIDCIFIVRKVFVTAQPPGEVLFMVWI